MHLNAQLDVELVAVEQEDELTVLLELQAPEREGEERLPVAVQVVLDRSGSMAGERLEAARRALLALVDRLAPEDTLGVVAFDDAVRVVLPAAPLGDAKPAARAAIAAIAPGGMTNLSAGLLRGLQEARRAAGPAGASLLLLSDGHANEGETDPDRLAGVAAAARKGGVTLSTIGIGLGYDEALLAAVARGGQGGHAFAQDGDAAGAAVAAEVGGLLHQTVQAATLTIRTEAPVDSVTVHNDLPAHAAGGALVVELGDFWAGEQRRVVLSFAVPAMPALGLAAVATLELRHVALPELLEQTVTVPLHVNVVPGDVAAGRTRDPKVHTELLYARTQDAKRQAAEDLARGDVDGAVGRFRAAAASLAAAPARSEELDEERRILRLLADGAEDGQAAWAAKRSRAEHAAKSRRRGRMV
jgi:Ca-activated chloride channel family protein